MLRNRFHTFRLLRNKSIMGPLTFLSVAIVCFQATEYVLAESNITADAQQALNSYLGKFKQSASMMEAAMSMFWNNYFNEYFTMIVSQRNGDIENILLILQNLTVFENYDVNGSKCTDSLPIFVDKKNWFVNEQTTYINIRQHALAEFLNSYKKYTELNQEFSLNCIQYTTNCEATSEFVVAEVERVLPKLRRIVYRLFMEIHYLGYDLGVKWELTRTKLLIDHNVAIRNATSCLVSKLERSIFNSTKDIPTNSTGSISTDLLALRHASEDVYLLATRHLFDNYLNMLDKCVKGSGIITSTIANLTHRVNTTAYALLEVAKNFEVAPNCSLSNLKSVIRRNVFTQKSLDYENEITSLLYQYTDGVNYLTEIYREVETIGKQLMGCYIEQDSPVCKALSEKVIAKTAEIPWLIQKSENSTSILLYQTATAIRERAAVKVTKAAEDLAAALFTFKSCIENAL
ncbi:hypothetical protein NQ318_014076 [Aromia moschata]|uniref:Uncharacterized protein n=1 Tax=Aromia moschata TaxID=1265417 RepID=A0AAV8Z023_9CUCU|nr:hypothetical protein NQ318_014076 [Aromia moschata]